MSAHEDRLLAGRAVFARVVADDVAAVVADVRAVLETQMRPGETLAAELPDGTQAGVVRRNRPSTYAAVTDARALLAWVTEHHPEELVRSVNPAYLEGLKRQVKVHGHAYDPTTKEVIPGVEMTTGSSAYKPEPDAAAVPLIRAKLAELVAGGLLELPREAAS